MMKDNDDDDDDDEEEREIIKKTNNIGSCGVVDSDMDCCLELETTFKKSF